MSTLLRRWAVASGLLLKSLGKRLVGGARAMFLKVLRAAKALLRSLRVHGRRLLEPKVGIPTALGGFVLVTYLLGVLFPKTVMVVTPFGVPVEEHRTISYSGESLANMLVDEFQDIIRTSNSFAGINDYSSSKQYGPLPETPTIPVQTSFEFSVHGVSVNEVLKILRFLRSDQESISGEVIRTGPGKVRLRVRLISSSRATYWELPDELPEDMDESEIRSRLGSLAARVFKDLHPATLGRYYLANRKYQKAKDVFAAWAAREPQDPYAYFYLGYSLHNLEQFDLAMAAEQRANDLEVGRNHRPLHRALGELAIMKTDQADLMDSRLSQSLYDDAIKENRDAIAASCLPWPCWGSRQARFPNYLLAIVAEADDLGVHLTQARRFTDAARSFDDALGADRKLLRSDRQNPGAWSNMGATLADVAYHEDRYLRDQDKHITGAVEQMECALSLKPYFPLNLSALVDALLFLQVVKDSERRAKGFTPSTNGVTDVGPAPPPCPERMLWDDSAVASGSMSPEKHAERVARWAVVMKPDAEEPLFELGLVLLQESMSARLRDVSEGQQLRGAADEAFSRALSLRPETSQTFTSQARKLQILDPPWAYRFSLEAVARLNRQLHDEPENTALMRSLGDAYYEAGENVEATGSSGGAEYSEAAISYRTALRQFTGYSRFAGFELQLANALYLSQDPDLDSALTHYTAAENLESNTADTCVFRFRLAFARQYSSSKDFKSAAKPYAREFVCSR